MTTLPRAQKGVVLVVGLVMLLLITLLVASAFTMSSGSLDAVSNQQWRSEAVSAADLALEQVMESDLVSAAKSSSLPAIDIDMNQDGVAEYQAAVLPPECVKATLSTATAPSSVTLAGISNSTWNTVLAMQASIDDAVTGASVTVRSGVRVLLSESEKNQVCP